MLLVVKYLNHKVHKGLHKGHKGKLEMVLCEPCASFVLLVVEYLNHKVHKDFHKGHKEKCQFIGVLWYIYSSISMFTDSGSSSILRCFGGKNMESRCRIT